MYSIAPLLQLYVAAPLAVSATLPEEPHKLVGEATELITGAGLTFKFKVAVVEHPFGEVIKTL